MDSLERLDVARAALRFEDCDVSFRESNRTAQFELPRAAFELSETSATGWQNRPHPSFGEISRRSPPAVREGF